MSDLPWTAKCKNDFNSGARMANPPRFGLLLDADPDAVDGAGDLTSANEAKNTEMDQFVQQRQDAIQGQYDSADASTSAAAAAAEASPQVSVRRADTGSRRTNEAVIEFVFDASANNAPAAVELDSAQLRHMFADSDGQLNLEQPHTIRNLRVTQVFSNAMMPIALHVRNVAGANTSVGIEQRRGKPAHAFTIEARANGPVDKAHGVIYSHSAVGADETWLANFDVDKERSAVRFDDDIKGNPVAHVRANSAFGAHLNGNAARLFDLPELQAGEAFENAHPTYVLPAKAVTDELTKIQAVRSKRLPTTKLNDLRFELSRYPADEAPFAHGTASANTKNIARTVSIHLTGELHKPNNK